MSERQYPHVLSFVLTHPWALTRLMVDTIASILDRRIAGDRASDAELEAAVSTRKSLPQPSGGAVAIIPVYGVLVPRASLMSNMSGGTSFEQLTGMLDEAMANAAVKTILLDIDSPGGSVAGATEFAALVRKARTTKPIIAVAQYTMASAAYWIAASATEIIASPSAKVGSVGVYAIHKDISGRLEKEGTKLTVIAAGKHKAEGHEAAPLTAEAEADIRASVDDAYADFVSDIAKGRRVPVADVRNGYGEGRVVSASEAKTLGMIDGIATLQETLTRVLSAAPTGTGPARAALTLTTDTQASSPDTDPVAVSDLDLERALFELTLSLT